MTELEARRVRDLLSPNNSLPNCLVYSPIEDWSNDDVWTFLMQVTNPWGYSNKELLTMYQGASPDGECPLVIDSSTPSCGDSRFGCWTCTLVDKDKSMSAIIQNDEEKEWMLPLLDLRNALDVADDRHLRDFRRMNGAVQLFHGKPIPGPYTQASREDWLRRLLEAQAFIRAEGPAYVRSLDLITQAELEEIRRIWVVEKHEFEDRLPAIYEQAMDLPYPGRPLDEHLPLGPELITTLRQVTGGDRLHFELIRELLDIEQRYRSQTRRAGLFDSLEGAIRRNFYDDENDATLRAQWRKAALERPDELRDEEPDPLDIADGYVRPAAGEVLQ
jgi:DNA sulfur modification protein DndC